MAKIPFKNLIFLMQKHLSSSTPTTQLSASAFSSSFTVDYLMNSCGLPLKSAIATSRKLRRSDENSFQRSDSVIALFKSHGFVTAHISEMIQKYPILLNQLKVEENLKPKLEYLVESGFSGTQLHDLIVSCPRILGTSLSGHLKPSLHFLRSFFGTEERLKLALKRNPRLLSNNLKATLQPNIDLLLKEGVPLHAITNFLVYHPPSMQSKVDRLVSALKMVKDLLNMRPTDPKFLFAVTRIASISAPLLEKKLQAFKSLGFSQQEALSIFKRYPECIALSEEKLVSKLCFYFNTVNLKTDDIIRCPVLLGLAIETRIRPRHNLLKLLLSKNLLREDTKIARTLVISEDQFLKKYATENLLQVPRLLEMYDNDRAAIKNPVLELVRTENMDLKADKENRGPE